MRTLFKTLFLSCVLTGCIIDQHGDLHHIINKNLEVYQKHEHIEFTTVAAIFKSYSDLTNKKEYKTTKELQDDTESFIENLRNNDISNNYPVRASEEEIYVTNYFLKDILKLLEKNDIRAGQFQNYINQALKIYVTEIISHEEKVRQ